MLYANRTGDWPFHSRRVAELASEKTPRYYKKRESANRIETRAQAASPREKPYLLDLFEPRGASVRSPSVFFRLSGNRLLLQRQLQSAAAENRAIANILSIHFM